MPLRAMPTSEPTSASEYAAASAASETSDGLAQEEARRTLRAEEQLAAKMPGTLRPLAPGFKVRQAAASKVLHATPCAYGNNSITPHIHVLVGLAARDAARRLGRRGVQA